jgi:hypothetical protein
MADGQRPIESEPARDLLRTPIGLEEGLHPRPVCGDEASVSPGAGATAAGVPVRELGAVAAIMMGAVTLQFPSHGAPMATQDPGDDAGGEPLSPSGGRSW